MHINQESDKLSHEYKTSMQTDDKPQPDMLHTPVLRIYTSEK